MSKCGWCGGAGNGCCPVSASGEMTRQRMERACGIDRATREVQADGSLKPLPGLRREEVPAQRMLVQDYDEDGRPIGEPYHVDVAAFTVLTGRIA